MLLCLLSLFLRTYMKDGVMCLQVKGQRKDQKHLKVKAKVDKQEVEIRQKMTVAALAEAMNKDFGKKQDRSRESAHSLCPLISNVYTMFFLSSDHVVEALLNTTVDVDSLELDSVLEERWIKEVVTQSGMKFRWAKLSESRERPNQDVHRRYEDRKSL